MCTACYLLYNWINIMDNLFCDTKVSRLSSVASDIQKPDTCNCCHLV